MDAAIIGVCERFGQEPIVAYDRARVIAVLAKDMGLEDAEEFFQVNTIGAWVGDNTPCFVTCSTVLVYQPGRDRVMISDQLKKAIKNAGIPQWKIARQNGVSPVTLSNWVTGARDVLRGDSRVLSIGRAVGVSADDCFSAAREERKER